MADELKRLLDALEVFRSIDDADFTLQLLVVFLYVALHDGCRQQEVVKSTGKSEAAVSRMLDWLGHEHRSGKPGLRLVIRKEDPDNYKCRRVYLTPKGKAIAQLISHQMT
jgi:DNA-binding MarR family transcriptional regulator